MFKNELFKSESGQSLIEYLIIVAIVAIGTMSIVRVVGKNVSVQFANIAKALGSGDDSQLKAEKPDSKMYSKKDLSNFLDGATSSDAKK
ncbi:MAG: Flp family type IVb pilin [Pseudobdellovibrionaceae bacterium]